MSLFPDEDILAREIETWRSFAESLRAEDRQMFGKMLDDCFRYATSVNAKGEPFPAEALLMALIFSQHKMIDWLVRKMQEIERRK